MDYPDALRYITSTGRFGIKLGLERVRALLDEVGAPDRGMRGVLVAGTNGKGSTCAFISSVLRRAGLRVAEMPKPHLVSYTERVVLDGLPISEAAFANEVEGLMPAIERVAGRMGPPTEFEILTTIAVRHAAREAADLLVCEVGMGGRLDATNVTDLGVKVITGVDLDHQRYLGETIALIAGEKAGIIRAGDLVVAGQLSPEAREVVVSRCDDLGARLWLAGRDFDAVPRAVGWNGVDFDFDSSDMPAPRAGLRVGMLGAHQAANAGVAVAALDAIAARHGIALDDQQLRDGLAAARWPGRLEFFPGSPRVLLDGGHNPAAVRAVVRAVEALEPRAVPVVLFGAMTDKDHAAMLAALPRAWPAVFTAVPEDRALSAGELLETARLAGRPRDSAVDGVPAALAAARDRAGAEGLVLVLGSLYLAGAVRKLLVTPGG